MKWTQEVYNLTPVERRGEIWLKRDDAFRLGPCNGGKLRTATVLSTGQRGVATGSHRLSPQLKNAAAVAKHLGIPCAVHTATGAWTPSMKLAARMNAEVVQHRPGYTSVLMRRAKDMAKERGWVFLPLGMEHPVHIKCTGYQVKNIPNEVKRIIMPVGSGMSLAGIVDGLEKAGRVIPIFGVLLGSDPSKRLEKYLSKTYKGEIILHPPISAFDVRTKGVQIEGVMVNQQFESKCAEFIQPGDLFWIIGK